jgi:hypothetical protein
MESVVPHQMVLDIDFSMCICVESVILHQTVTESMYVYVCVCVCMHRICYASSYGNRKYACVCMYECVCVHICTESVVPHQMVIESMYVYVCMCVHICTESVMPGQNGTLDTELYVESLVFILH